MLSLPVGLVWGGWYYLLALQVSSAALWRLCHMPPFWLHHLPKENGIYFTAHLIKFPGISGRLR